jgi:hypothetical protein
MSHELALMEGAYETFEGSPFSQGILQFDMWRGEGEGLLSGRWLPPPGTHDDREHGADPRE